jgi:hypothetical protein
MERYTPNPYALDVDKLREQVKLQKEIIEELENAIVLLIAALKKKGKAEK